MMRFLFIAAFIVIALLFLRGVYLELVRDPIMGRFRRPTYGDKDER